MPRERSVRFQCSHPGCQDVAHYSFQYRDEGQRLHATYGNGKYKCARHSRPEEVLATNRRKIVTEQASEETVPGHLYWNHWGFVSGPGFRAWASDFPKGTILRVTAEVILPNGAVENGANAGDGCGSEQSERVATSSTPPQNNGGR